VARISRPPVTELRDIVDEFAYGLRVKVALPFEAAVERVTAGLKAEGFGVLTTIDVKQTLKVKLDQDFRKYVILGACNPPLASRALHAELEVGLLLPCNVIVYEAGANDSVVAAMAPLAAMGIVGAKSPVFEVATEADARIRRVMQSVERH